MKRMHLNAVLIGLAAIVTADASAMYNPRMGVFMQRDPGPGAGRPMRIGTGGPAVGGSFAGRDRAAQYADGMDLYQYGRSNPITGVDPTGTIVIVMSGCRRPQSDMTKIRDRIISKLKTRLSKYDRGAPTIGWRAAWDGPLEDDDRYDQEAGSGSYDDFVRRQFDAFVARKRRDPCRLEQFVAVGHSSGASAILNQIKAHNLNKHYPPAFLGMIDPVLHKHGRDITMENGGYTHEVVYYQREDLLLFLRGAPVPGADENTQLRNTNHFDIVKDERVVEGIAEKAAQSYEMRVQMELQWGPGKAPWDTSGGHMQDGGLAGKYW